MYNRRSRVFIIPTITDCGVWCGMPLVVLCKNHSTIPIYGGYLPWTGVCFLALIVHLALSVLATLDISVDYMYVLWCLEHSWCSQ